MSLKWFPVQLAFSLPPIGDSEQIAAEIHASYPELSWGVEQDLLKASTDWPHAVLEVSDMRTHGPEYAEFPYPITLDFIVFPERIKGKEDLMLPTFIAMMQDLSRRFECPVLGDASDHVPQPSETHEQDDAAFLMQGGVLYTCAWSPYHVRYFAAAQPGDWLPVTDLPELKLDAAGRLTDPAMIASYKTWRETRRSPPPFPPERLRALYQNEAEETEDQTDSNFNPYGSLPEPDHQANEDITPWDDLSASEPPAANGPSDEEFEDYFKKVDAYVEGRGATSSQRLIQDGVTLPAADQMDDQTLSAKLAEVIAALAEQRTFLHCTNHLTDRELYTHLWEESLNEVSMDIAGSFNASCNIDLLGSCSEEDMRLHTIHYASPERRAKEAAEWPDKPIPAHIPPPMDRDRHLPKPRH